MFDFSSAAADLVAAELSVPRSEGSRLCEELGWFFRAVAADPAGGPLVPSRRVDDAWHVLLRHEDVYGEFCASTCGRHVRHLEHQFPPVRYTVTREAILNLRGAVPVDYWPPSDRGDCGGSAEEERENEDRS